MVRARLLMLAVLVVWGLLSGSALMAIFPAQFQVVEEHEEKPHRAASEALIEAQVPQAPGADLAGPASLSPRTCRRAAPTAARLARHVRPERSVPLRL